MTWREIIGGILSFFSGGGLGFHIGRETSIKQTSGEHSNQIAGENIETANTGTVVNFNLTTNIYNNTFPNGHEGASIGNEMSKKEHQPLNITPNDINNSFSASIEKDYIKKEDVEKLYRNLAQRNKINNFINYVKAQKDYYDHTMQP